jgi:hypothetical protein
MCDEIFRGSSQKLFDDSRLILFSIIVLIGLVVRNFAPDTGGQWIETPWMTPLFVLELQ